ncbi:uncharacterized protein BO97DRAFT_428920 [Aspergillus homomorphus CBS 101889]|uniref:Zn(2)-C6 fungal-type domain-containing protein n=1 Tax=Aspergillus homomorphus (strain CBS 101889) TaxID=1450537 RepID=A0A395HJD2_ASPHC|nr:hypothetical protein BO97DRAFT_428920 [Aspergillus homomorphus CBS 101889]RAL07880.1 hypothetical protein BO97DRAFT_428920 [Aspergillus homomorphus CBS 101889]
MLHEKIQHAALVARSAANATVHAPVCRRCQVKRLKCEGYPPRYVNLEEPSIHKRPRTENTSLYQHGIFMLLASEASSNTPNNSIVISQPPSSVEVRPRKSSSRSSKPSSRRRTRTRGQQPVTNTRATSAFMQEDWRKIHKILESAENQRLVLYFRTTVCAALGIETSGTPNPYRAYVLPLAHQDLGNLHAVLALASCHQHPSEAQPSTNKISVAAMIEHQLAGMQSLSALLIREELYGLGAEELDILLGTVLPLCALRCESSILYVDNELLTVSRSASRASPRTAFLITTLAWLNLLRGFSGAEKLAYDEDVHRCVLQFDHFNLESMFGCPVDLFYRISRILSSAKHYLAGALSFYNFEQTLAEAERFFRTWVAKDSIETDPAPSPSTSLFPPSTLTDEWKALAEAYRHACIIRVLRFPDTRLIPCEDPTIEASVVGILDAAASIATESPLVQAVAVPALHCRRRNVRAASAAVWEEIAQQVDESKNVPWMEYTCSIGLVRQHDYLFF